jgi:hypothetical protein
VQDPDNSKGHVIEEELNVWPVVIKCNCNRDVQ